MGGGGGGGGGGHFPHGPPIGQITILMYLRNILS